MNRRKFLAVLGGGVILAAGAAGAGFVATRRPDAALAPWDAAGTAYQEPRRRALSYAILAANPHNRQPWLVDLRNAGRVVLYCDLDRLLPETDPHNRQITIGLGCFIEVLRMAAAEDGYRLDISMFPSGSDVKALDRRPVADIRFEKDANQRPDPLFRHIMNRRSVKEPFDTDRRVSDQQLLDIKAAATGTYQVNTSNNPVWVKTLRDLTWKAMEIEMRTPHTHMESVNLFRIGKSEINANPDGIDFSGAFFESLNALGQFSREGTGDPTSTEFQMGLDIIRELCMTGMAYVWLTSPANTRQDQLAAGRDWIRINLAVTGLGLSVQPMSQALQEYPEMAGPFDEVHKMLAPAGGTVQMLGRLGYGPDVAPSPRWSLDTRIVKA